VYWHEGRMAHGDYVVVVFSNGGKCILRFRDSLDQYMNDIAMELQPYLGTISAVSNYVWKEADATRDEITSRVYVDNICGKVYLTGAVCEEMLLVAEEIDPSFHFGIKYMFYTTHGQYMMQKNKRSLTFKGCKDIAAVRRFVGRLSDEISFSCNVDMVSVTCHMYRPICIAMGSLLDTMLSTSMKDCVNVNMRSDEDTQQLHFKITDWTPFIEDIRETNNMSDGLIESVLPYLSMQAEGNQEEGNGKEGKCRAATTTSVGVNGNSVFKIRFAWSSGLHCASEDVIPLFCNVGHCLAQVILGKIGAL
jgi:hypothetical protein